jgi:sulfur carrier protein
MALRVTVNGEPHDLPEATTVRRLIEILDLAGGPVAVEKNGDVVPRAEHPTTPLADGDVLEIVHFVGGG